MKKAVLDRFEDHDLAVLLIGENEKEYNVSRSILPKEVKEGSHLFVKLENDIVHSVTLDEEATKATENRIHNKMDKLREMKKMKRRSK
ncbi:DUF3006 domain-containing protein [Alkalicoccobacillus porphyridii]|uniref:DUF3006 domain-containing protein n=1 Tax=Alkalicoccobacillus porphyridii TaxID=2597270 RepID=A0A554A1Q5_9BACI|nr:DUF3006 domain-containing protein [Alkalicoccobacillus porphyridii]TSB47630.1 DUF3006 domain-containing protein [Alkalicoccobacillus porphyridii]